MNTYTGIITGQSVIEKNRDGENDVRMLQVEITDENDIQKVQQVTWSGDDNSPVEGDTVVIVEISPAYKIVLGIEDSIDPEVDSGERKLYSQDGGAIQSSIYLKKDGQMLLNGDGDYAVRFNELKTAFDQLKADHDSHFHTTTATVGASATPGVISPVAAGSTANIDPAKIDSIEVPS